MLLAGASAVQAELFDRGGGMVYDSAKDITWLADWNYAKSSGYDGDGRMTWFAANTWADNLVHGGFSDWRLPTVAQPDNSCSLNFNCSGSELGHVFYRDLGGKAHQSVLDPSGDTAVEIANLARFQNMQSYAYWANEYAPFPTTLAWYFATDIGMESFGAKTGSLFAVAVRTGDVAAVPEPQAYWMLTLGLVGLMLAVRRWPD